MPIYEYQCTHCAHTLDAFQSMSDAALIDCPACGTAHLQKLVSAAGFQLKGTGWYATDFKNKSQSSKKESEPKTEVKADKLASSTLDTPSSSGTPDTNTTTAANKTDTAAS